jgi:hypothetical protein
VNNKKAIIDIARFHHLRVCYVVDRPATDPLLVMVLGAACNGRTDWNVAEWDALVKHIRQSNLTVGEFLTECENEGENDE